MAPNRNGTANDNERTDRRQAGHRKKRGIDMFKKLFAAAICGAVIASIASHADAAGPGGFARGFAVLERDAVSTLAPMTSADKIDISRHKALSAMDQYFSGFDQSQPAD